MLNSLGGLSLLRKSYIMERIKCPVMCISLPEHEVGYHFIPWDMEREWLMVSRDCKTGTY